MGMIFNDPNVDFENWCTAFVLTPNSFSFQKRSLMIARVSLVDVFSFPLLSYFSLIQHKSLLCIANTNSQKARHSHRRGHHPQCSSMIRKDASNSINYLPHLIFSLSFKGTTNRKRFIHSVFFVLKIYALNRAKESVTTELQGQEDTSQKESDTYSPLCSFTIVLRNICMVICDWSAAVSSSPATVLRHYYQYQYWSVWF